MQISIKDFLRIESLVLDLQAPINVIVGENEAGKSSIGHALRWCLTGEARGCKTHEQQAALIRTGGKAAEVKTTFPNGSEVFRKKTPKSPPSVIGAVPEDAVMAAILCDPLAFLGFPGAQRREILFRLLPGLNPTAGEIHGRFLKIPEIAAFYDPKDPIRDSETNRPVNSKIMELSDLAATKGFKAAMDEAVIRRQIAKRLREGSKIKEPDEKVTIGDKLFILPDNQETEVQAGLTKLQGTRDQFLQKKGLANGELDELPDLEKELTALESNPITAPKPGEIKRLQSALEASRPIMADLQKQVDALSTVKAPKAYPSICPAFPGSEIPCPKAGEMAISGQKASNTTMTEKLRADLKTQKDKVARLEEDLQKATVKQAACDDYPKKRLNLIAKIAGLKEQTAATVELNQQIAALDARIQIGSELLDAVRTFWRKKNEVDAGKTELAKADKEAVLNDALAKALAPEGIPSRLIAEALKPMNDLLQVAAAHLFPDRALVLNRDLEIELAGAPYVTLCKSEQFRVGVAFQYGLGKLAGARLLMLDEADILDSQNRDQLIGFLLEIQPEFDTILVFATADNARASLDPDIQVWVLMDGKIYPLNKGFRFKDGKIISEAGALEKEAA